jgi:hypothetical protein
MSDDDTISSLFPEVVEFVMDLGVELEDSITDMLAIDSDDHPVVLMNLQVIMGAMIHRISPSRPSTVFN